MLEQPIQMRPAARYGATRRLPGVLILYPDRLVHVTSWVTNWCAGLGFLIIYVASLPVSHTGPGALGGAIGAGGGTAIGNAIAKRQAPKKAAAGGDHVTVIPLDSITRVQEGRAGWAGGGRLLVSTSPQAEYTFRAKLDQWSAYLASAFAGRGRSVQATPSGLEISEL